MSAPKSMVAGPPSTGLDLDRRASEQVSNLSRIPKSTVETPLVNGGPTVSFGKWHGFWVGPPNARRDRTGRHGGDHPVELAEAPIRLLADVACCGECAAQVRCQSSLRHASVGCERRARVEAKSVRRLREFTLLKNLSYSEKQRPG